jgi:cytochrome c peroxidase
MRARHLTVIAVWMSAVAVSSLSADDAALRASLPAPVVDSDFYDDGAPPEARFELGRLLFFDKLLSGNRNIACATCHHPTLATADGVALGFGEGAAGLGPERRPGATKASAVHGRMPRNSPALFNLGAREFETIFHDGRVQTDPNGYYEGGFVTPAKWKLHQGLDNALAAQAMFSVINPTAMAGQKGENTIADAKSLNNAAGPGGVWAQLAERLREVPGYVDLFRAAFPERVKTKEDITYVLAANAIAAFEAAAFRADDAPLDRYLRGDDQALSEEAKRGAGLFYGRAGCAGCHSGKFQTDHQFHAIAMPQIGPGKADGSNGNYWSATGVRAFVEDFGRGRVTVRKEDRYTFRTPSLRNVALTGPWGHAGSHATLESVVRHHLAPVESLESYEIPDGLLQPLDSVLEMTMSGSSFSHSWLSDSRLEGFLARDGWVQQDAQLRKAIADANELDPVELTDREFGDLIAFLHSLTDPSHTGLVALIPESVPSGLPVADQAPLDR